MVLFLLQYLYMLVVGGAILAAGVLAMLFLKRKNLVSLGPRIRAHRRSSRGTRASCSPSIMRVMKSSPGSEHYAFELL